MPGLAGLVRVGAVRARLELPDRAQERSWLQCNKEMVEGVARAARSSRQEFGRHRCLTMTQGDGNMYGNTNGGLASETDKAGISARHEETMAQLSRTVSQAEDLLRALGDEGGQAIDAMRSRVSATLRDARERLSGHASQAKGVASDTMTRADAYVHANPWRAVAIGAGIGALLAILLSRRTIDSLQDTDFE